MDIIRELEKDFMKKEITDFKVGDTIRVAVRIKEEMTGFRKLF